MTKPVRTEDTEDGRYDLVVRATDQGRDTQLYSDIRVVIEVRQTLNLSHNFTTFS